MPASGQASQRRSRQVASKTAIRPCCAAAVSGRPERPAGAAAGRAARCDTRRVIQFSARGGWARYARRAAARQRRSVAAKGSRTFTTTSAAREGPRGAPAPVRAATPKSQWLRQ